MKKNILLVLFVINSSLFYCQVNCDIVKKAVTELRYNVKLQSYIIKEISILKKQKFRTTLCNKNLLVDIAPHFIFSDEELQIWKISSDSVKMIMTKNLWNDSYCLYASLMNAYPLTPILKYTPLTFYMYKPHNLTVKFLLAFEENTNQKHKIIHTPRFGNYYFLTLNFDKNEVINDYMINEVFYN